jgi:hypothetical protein
LPQETLNAQNLSQSPFLFFCAFCAFLRLSNVSRASATAATARRPQQTATIFLVGCIGLRDHSCA